MDGGWGLSYVILEGVDCAGKSYLAEELTEDYRCQIVPVGPPADDAGSELGRYLRLCMAAAEQRTIFDRLHLGSYAYGKEFRRDIDGMGDIPTADWETLEELITEDSVLVLCDPGWEQIQKVWKERRLRNEANEHSHFEEDLERMCRVYANFREAYQHSKLRKMEYNWTEDLAWQHITDFLWENLGWNEA